MSNYVPSIPDCKKWKKLISTLAKDHSMPKCDPDSGIKVIVSNDVNQLKQPSKKKRVTKSSCLIKKPTQSKHSHKPVKSRPRKTTSKGKKKANK